MDILRLVLILCLTLFADGQDTILTSTRLGDIIGVRRYMPAINSTVHMYRSIPFAKPPVGSLRFEKPVSYGPWNGTLDATQASPSCYQFLGTAEALLENKEISEDCLYLNIYVPSNVSDFNNKSVMVWIHGGGYRSGQAQLYDGAYLAVLGDVIVVTINYRLNVFGFLSLGDIKGNFGLWDQIMAIQWVKENIGSFGGDSQSITIFGNSAGAFSVGLLSIIPSNRGLFKRVILQSGSAFSAYALSSITRSVSEEVANSLNCLQSNDVTVQKNCLKNVSAADLFTASNRDNFTSSLLHVNFAPVIDSDLLTNHPENVLADSTSDGSKFYRSLDLVIGTTTGESSLLLTVLRDGLQDVLNFTLSDGIPRRVLCDVIAPDIATVGYNNALVSEAVCEKYGRGNVTSELSMNILNCFSDFAFDIPTVKSLRAHISGPSSERRHYHYLFSRASPIILFGPYPQWFSKAEHGSEIVFLFPFAVGLSPEDSQLSLNFMKYLANFAKTGNMDVNDLPQWTQYDITNEYYLEFDVNVTKRQHLYRDRVNFWLTEIPALIKGQTSGSSYLTKISLHIVFGFWFICSLEMLLIY